LYIAYEQVLLNYRITKQEGGSPDLLYQFDGLMTPRACCLDSNRGKMQLDCTEWHPVTLNTASDYRLLTYCRFWPMVISHQVR